jgi:hypothetical protein
MIWISDSRAASAEAGNHAGRTDGWLRPIGGWIIAGVGSRGSLGGCGRHGQVHATAADALFFGAGVTPSKSFWFAFVSVRAAADRSRYRRTRR